MRTGLRMNDPVTITPNSDGTGGVTAFGHIDKRGDGSDYRDGGIAVVRLKHTETVDFTDFLVFEGRTWRVTAVERFDNDPRGHQSVTVHADHGIGGN